MKTKYFRFLYCVQKSCVIHFGELTDTLTGEHFSFVYVSEGQVQAMPAASGKDLFLCPGQVDLVVLGDANERTDEVLQGILNRSEVKLLVLPETGYRWGARIRETAKQMYLSSESERVCHAEAVTEMGIAERAKSLMLTAAGWRFFMTNIGGDGIAMAHSLDGNPEVFRTVMGKEDGNQMVCGERNEEFAGEQNDGQDTGNGSTDQIEWRNRAGRAAQRKETDNEWRNPFEDCIMNVKILDAGELCCRETEPDGYACALGCALRKDSDLCRYQRARKDDAYLTGTLLLGGRKSGDTWRKMEEEIGAWMEDMRFFLLPMTCTEEKNQKETKELREEKDKNTKAEGNFKTEYNENTKDKSEEEKNKNGNVGEEKQERTEVEIKENTQGENKERTEICFANLKREYKRYYIGGKETADVRAVKELCCSGLYQIPVLLGDGDGICCSGMLKYADQK